MITKTVFKSRAEWLAYRNEKFVIGGSNIGAILGLSKHTTPLQVWLKWQNRTTLAPKQSMYRGRFMEDGIARWFEHETGLKVVKRSAEIAVYHNDEYPEYVQVSPDREVFQKGTEFKNGRPFLECKDTSMYVDFDDLDSIPSEWFLQCQLEAEIGGRPGTYLAINDGSKSMKQRLIAPDKEYIKNCINQACEWVERHIIGGVRPEAVNGEDVRSLYPNSCEGVIKIGESKRSLYETAIIRQEAYRKAEKEFNEALDALKSLFDERDTLVLDGMNIATYKTQKRTGFDRLRLVADYPELAEKYNTTSTYRVIKLFK